MIKIPPKILPNPSKTLPKSSPNPSRTLPEPFPGELLGGGGEMSTKFLHFSLHLGSLGLHLGSLGPPFWPPFWCLEAAWVSPGPLRVPLGATVVPRGAPGAPSGVPGPPFGSPRASILVSFFMKKLLKN